MSTEQFLVESNELSPDEYDELLDELENIPSPRAPIDGEGLRLLFEFMEDTGLRITETLHVRKRDIDLRTRIITVTHPKSEKQCKCSKWKYKDEYTRSRVLVSANKKCPMCKGKGKWKKPQRTTFTPRLDAKLDNYIYDLNDNDLLFPVNRKTVWRWGKEAGNNIGLSIFQQKEERLIHGIFLHLFRAMCSKRMIRDAKHDDYKDQIVAVKLRHSFNTVTDRYTKIDINYLLNWEEKTYDDLR